MNMKYQTIMLTAALICGAHSAVADEREDIVLPVPPPPFAPEFNLRIAPVRAVERLHEHIHDRVHHIMMAPLKFLAQVTPPTAPAISIEPAPPGQPGKPRHSSRAVSEEDVLLKMASGSRGGRSLVIPKDDMDAETLAATEEDLNVMALILDKAVVQRSDDDRKVLGIDIFGSSSSSSARNLFVEGHGAIFLLKTRLTLTPPAVEKEETKTKESKSSEWEDARRQLYGPNEWEREVHKALRHVTAFSGSAIPYDEDKVNDLKSSVIESLKNATHIRGMKGDHTVTVVISGAASSEKAATVARREGDGKSDRRVYVRDEKGEGRRGSVMMVQAKKSDIDTFAKESNADSFGKKVKVRIY